MGGVNSTIAIDGAVADVVAHIITLIPVEDARTVIAMSRVCRACAKLPTMFLVANNIIDTRELPLDEGWFAKVNSVDRYHGSVSARATLNEMSYIRCGIRGWVMGIGEFDHELDSMQYTFKFGRLARMEYSYDLHHCIEYPIMFAGHRFDIECKYWPMMGNRSVSLKAWTCASHRYSICIIGKYKPDHPWLRKQIIIDETYKAHYTTISSVFHEINLFNFLQPYMDEMDATAAVLEVARELLLREVPPNTSVEYRGPQDASAVI